MLNRIIATSAVILLAACSTATPAPVSPAASGSQTSAAAKPDAAKLVQHMQEHVSYPASRADVLAACASTPEFSAEEKQWTADNLPEGSYTDADAVVAALGI